MVQEPPCPHCQATQPEAVKFTWWGGLLGPRLFHHVRCLKMRQDLQSQDREVQRHRDRHLSRGGRYHRPCGGHHGLLCRILRSVGDVRLALAYATGSVLPSILLCVAVCISQLLRFAFTPPFRPQLSLLYSTPRP